MERGQRLPVVGIASEGKRRCVLEEEKGMRLSAVRSGNYKEGTGGRRGDRS